MKISIHKLAFFSLFLDNWVLMDFGFDFHFNYIMFILYIIYVFSTHKIILKREYFILFCIVSCLLFSVVFTKSKTFIFLFFKQFLLIVFSLFFAFSLLIGYKYNLRKIIYDYISIAKFICIIGIIQVISIVAKFKYGSDFSYLGFYMQNFSFDHFRIQSIFLEPSFLGYFLTPLVFIVVAQCFKLCKLFDLRTSLLFIITLLITSSSVAFLGLLTSIVIVILVKYPIYKNLLYFILSFTFTILVAIALYNISYVKNRVDDSASLYFSEIISKNSIEKVNASTYTLYTNYRVTKESLLENPLFGSGLGSYRLQYDKYLNNVIPKVGIRTTKLNREDANSLLLRFLTELGIVGVILIIYYYLKNRISYSLIKNSEYGQFLWAINNGIFVMVLTRLLRQGHYAALGFIFFLILYFLTSNIFTYKAIDNCNYLAPNS